MGFYLCWSQQFPNSNFTRPAALHGEGVSTLSSSSRNQILLDLWGSHNIKNPEQGSISLIMAVHNLDCLLHWCASYKILKQWAHSDTDQEEFSRAVFEVWLGDRVHQSSFIIFFQCYLCCGSVMWNQFIASLTRLSNCCHCSGGREEIIMTIIKKAPDFFLGWGSFLLFCAW